MPVYHYKAVDKRGRGANGTMPAPDEVALGQKLLEAGLWLTDANVHKATPARRDRAAGLRGYKLRGKNASRELIDFCTLMTYQIRVGIPLVRALEASSQDCKNPGFKEVLVDLQRSIEGGLQFHEALAQYPGVFSTHFLSVIKAGELSSNLPEAFNDLREYLEWCERINAEVKQASLYPAIVMTVIGAFALFLFTFIIPKFAQLLTSLKVQQPLLTQVVFGLGDIAKATWWLTIPLLLLLVLTMTVGRRISPRIARALDKLKLHVPIFGELNLMLAISRFSHNLSILYRSGLPILQALNLCRQGLIGNIIVEEAVGGVEAEVKTGSSISEAMHRHPIFPALILRMVAMGEASGNLDKALQNVSDYYNDVIPRRIKSVFTVLEPMLMLLLIFIVGCVALAIYLPIISLMGSIRH
jgi:type II secretory pathway component PulF